MCFVACLTPVGGIPSSKSTGPMCADMLPTPHSTKLEIYGWPWIQHIGASCRVFFKPEANLFSVFCWESWCHKTTTASTPSHVNFMSVGNLRSPCLNFEHWRCSLQASPLVLVHEMTASMQGLHISQRKSNASFERKTRCPAVLKIRSALPLKD